MKNAISQSIKKTTRIESLDLLRGIAAFAVVLFHYTAITSIQLEDGNPLRIVGVYGHFGVEIFFTISGFVIPYSMYVNSYRINLIWRFLLKRTIRLELPYLVLIVLEVLVIYLRSFTEWKPGFDERLNVYEILLHVGYLNGVLGKPWLIPVFWTLAIEFQFYLLMAILFPAFLGKFRIPLIILIASLSFISPQLYLFFKYGLFFLTGIAVFLMMSKITKRLESVVLIVSLLFLIYLQNGFFTFLIISMAMAVILFVNCNWKWSRFLGMISYSIYLVHVPFGGRLLRLTQMYVHSEVIKSVLIIAYFALTILAAWAFYLLVERPSLLLSKKITY